MSKRDPHELHERDLDFLDRLHVVACLLHPFGGSAGNPGFEPGDDARTVNDHGFRFLERVVAAIDDALEVHAALEEYNLTAMSVLVPMRYTLHSLSEARRFRGHPSEVDHQLPDNAAEIIDFCFDAARRAAADFREEAMQWYREQTEEAAHA